MSTPREQKKAALIKAAAVVFAAQGFANTRIADIARQGGVGKSTVYEYFVSKEELFFAVFEATNTHIDSRVKDCLTRTSAPLEQLAAVIDECATIVAELRETYSLNFDFWATCRGGDGEGRFKSAIEGLYRDYRGIFAEIIRRGQECGDIRPDLDPEALGAIFVGTLDGLGIQHWIDPSIDPHQTVEGLLTVLQFGLTTNGDSQWN